MIELDLNELHWNPDTCGCQIEITKEETRITGHEEFPASDLRVAQGRRATLVRSRNGSLVYRLPVYETIKVNAAGKVLFKRSHEPFESAPPPGIRLRGTVIKPCPDHVGFKGVVQTQRVRCPTVCGCVWQELWGGEKKEGGLFGSFMERVCQDHKDVPLAQIRETVIALART